MNSKAQCLSMVPDFLGQEGRRNWGANILSAELAQQSGTQKTTTETLVLFLPRTVSIASTLVCSYTQARTRGSHYSGANKYDLES